VSTVNEDDFNGDCKCDLQNDYSTAFPALRIIDQVYNHKNMNVESFTCRNGNFPIIL